MPHRLLKVLLTAGLCTALLPAVALAKDHGKGHDRDDQRRKLPPASGSTTANAGASNGPHSRWVLNQNNNKK